MNTYDSPSLRQVSVGAVWNPPAQYLPVRTSQLVRLKTITRSLLRAALGGAIGGYVLLIALFIAEGPGGFFPPVVVLIIWMFLGMVLGLVTGTLTLIFENLIEEDLEMFPRAIATSVFSFLILLGLGRITDPLEVSAKTLVLPAIALGFPAGLISGSKLRIRQLLRHGVEPGSDAASYSFWSLLSRSVAIVLRTAAIVGILTSIAALVILWRSIELPERMVLIYCIYYFTLSAIVTIFVRSTQLTVLAGLFLNSLLIFLAVFWESSSETFHSGGLLLSCAVFGGLWLVFMVSKRTTHEERVLISELGR